MAVTARKTPDAILHALVYAHNLRMEEAVSTNFHADTTQVTTGDYTSPTVTDDTLTAAHAVPTDTTTAITCVNAFKKVINRHFADTRAHNTAVSSAVSTADATDLTTANTLANALKSAYGTHLAAASVHFNNDGTNTIAAADGTNITTLIALLTELRTDGSAHIVNATLGTMINVIDA